jgi:uncharacterized protein (DUF58 family)
MTSEILDLDLVQRLESLELRARYVVEGFLSGLNRSPFRGFSVEFAEYRHYFPGDPLRLIDWKLYGRTDRLYVKQFEEETNLQCHLLLDLSGSMNYRSRAPVMTKIDYARTMAASLAFFLHRQRDSVGVTLLKPDGIDYLYSRVSNTHLRQVMNNLEGATAAGEIDLAGGMQTFANLLHRRSLIILISDFYETPEALASALKRLRYDHHEVIALQILDPAEIDFDFWESSFFHDLENGSRLVIDPASIRREYQKNFKAHQRQIAHVMRDYEVDLTQFRTNTPMEGALSAYLSKREGKQ